MNTHLYTERMDKHFGAQSTQLSPKFQICDQYAIQDKFHSFDQDYTVIEERKPTLFVLASCLSYILLSQAKLGSFCCSVTAATKKKYIRSVSSQTKCMHLSQTISELLPIVSRNCLNQKVAPLEMESKAIYESYPNEI